MSNLFATLGTSGNALEAYQQALNVVQNNINNSTTPGFASQSINLVPQPFDLAGGLAGGVAARGLISARDEYSEEEVRRQVQLLGLYQSQAQGATSLSNFFDPTGNSGVPAQWSQLLNSFSAWSLNPSSTSARQSVLDSANTLASGVRSLAASLSQTGQNIQGQIGSTVQQINQLTAHIQQYNIQRLRSPTPDPNLDAQVHSALEQLSQLADVSAVAQADGTFTVVLSGGAPLVVGASQFALSANSSVPAGAANPKSPPSSHILDAQGNDITAQITGGNLGGLLDVHNRILASVLGDATQAGSLNTFAKSLADTVNGLLQSGTTSPVAGSPQGTALFSYDNSDATTAAASLVLNPAITPDALAPVDANGNANGNALQLASLANSTASGGINGQTFGDFFAGITSALGNEAATATANQQAQTQVTDQTKAMRDQISAVSLDQQAIVMTQFQNSYNAVAKLVTVIDNLTQTTINMLP
jgi:flagellar hook-associated protein 1 FlgK